MLPDRPIIDCKEDRFERLSFSNYIANCLLLPENAPSIVVGIEGKWGEGKTSCINMIKKVLEKDKRKPIVIDYAPWLISSIDSLIEGFFIQLAAAIGKKNGKNALDTTKKVLQFAKILTPIKLIPGVEPWGTIVEKILSTVGTATNAAQDLANLNLEERKIELQKYLNKLKCPIVVIIDDIDRLRPEDIRTVFQMLKAVANFPRVSYLIAYDPSPIIKALSFEINYDGKQYLEKLVQISYSLPRLSVVHRKAYLKTLVNTLFTECQLNLSQSESMLWKSLIDRTDLVRFLATPREIVRLTNRLRLVLENTKDEVCFADAVVFEFLDMKYTKIIKTIRKEPERYIYIDGRDDEFVSNDVGQNIQMRDMEENKSQLLNKLLKHEDYSERELLAIKQLLAFIFPKLDDKGSWRSGNNIGINRISKRDALLKLLHVGLTSFTHSTVNAVNFLTKPEERRNILNQWRQNGDISGNLMHVADIFGEEEIPISDIEGLCDLLMKEAEWKNGEKNDDNNSISIGIFFKELLIAISNSDEQLKLLKMLVSKPYALATSLTPLFHFLIQAGIWVDGRFHPDESDAKDYAQGRSLLPYQDLYELINIWLESVRDVARSKDIIYSQYGCIDILYRWGQLNNNSYEEVHEYIETKMNDIDWLLRLLELFEPDRAGFPNFLPISIIQTIKEHLQENENAQRIANNWSRYVPLEGNNS